MIQNKINDELKNAMKAKNELVVSTLRLLNSEIKNVEIDKHAKLTDEEIVKVIQKQAKLRKDAIEAYKKAGALDKVDREAEELAILEVYLPTPMSEDEIERIVDETIASTGATSISDMRKVMAMVMDKTKGLADGKKVADLVLAKLQR